MLINSPLIRGIAMPQARPTSSRPNSVPAGARPEADGTAIASSSREARFNPVCSSTRRQGVSPLLRDSGGKTWNSLMLIGRTAFKTCSRTSLARIGGNSIDLSAPIAVP